MDNKLTTKQNVWQLIKFTLISISAGVIQIGSFALFSQLIFNDASNEYGVSYFISLTLSVLWNFTINREYTFKSATNVPIAMLKVFAFYVVFTPLSIWWGEALVGAGWNDFLVLAFTMIINFVTEFLYCRFFVYRNSINTNKRAQVVENNEPATSNEVEQSVVANDEVVENNEHPTKQTLEVVEENKELEQSDINQNN